MLDKVLEQIAEKIITLDEASLTELLPLYKKKMEQFEPSDDWEKAVVIFFLINAVRVKNSIFNENVAKGHTASPDKAKTKDPRLKDCPLRLIKS